MSSGGFGGFDNVSNGNKVIGVARELNTGGLELRSTDVAALIVGLAQVRSEVFDIAFDLGTELAISQDLLLVTTLEAPNNGTRQFLFDHTQAATLIAERVSDQRAFDTALSEDGRVLVVNNDTFANFAGQTLELLAPVAGVLQVIDSVDVSALSVNHIVFFEDDLAVLATPTGLQYVDARVTLTIGPTLDLSASPRDATIHDGLFVVTSGDTVEVVTPPCPPLSRLKQTAR